MSFKPQRQLVDKLRFVYKSEWVSLSFAALQDLEPQQLLLFVQSFGIPVSSMSKLLQYLDQAVSHDPQTLEQNIMDKSEDLSFGLLCSLGIQCVK